MSGAMKLAVALLALPVLAEAALWERLPVLAISKLMVPFP